jgi:hypothetical protein
MNSEIFCNKFHTSSNRETKPWIKNKWKSYASKKVSSVLQLICFIFPTLGINWIILCSLWFQQNFLWYRVTENHSHIELQINHIIIQFKIKYFGPTFLKFIKYRFNIWCVVFRNDLCRDIWFFDLLLKTQDWTLFYILTNFHNMFKWKK